MLGSLLKSSSVVPACASCPVFPRLPVSGFDHTASNRKSGLSRESGNPLAGIRSSAFAEDKFRGGDRASHSHSYGRFAGQGPLGTGERARENTKNNTNEATMLLKTQDGNCKMKLKRTEKAPYFEGQMRRSNPKSELSCKACVQAEGLCPEIPMGLKAAIVRRLAGSRENTKIVETKPRSR